MRAFVTGVLLVAGLFFVVAPLLGPPPLNGQDPDLDGWPVVVAIALVWWGGAAYAWFGWRRGS